MGSNTKIGWTDSTWNPVTGCTPVSAACDHCYARRYARRGIGDFRNGREFADVLCHPDRLEIPLHWRQPRKIFVCSMGDLFQEEVFRIMLSAHWHSFQVLTKRADIMCARVPEIMERIGSHQAMPANIWLGVTAENQAAADERIPLLLQTPAAVRFLSCEPLLGCMNLWPFIGAWCSCGWKQVSDWTVDRSLARPWSSNNFCPRCGGMISLSRRGINQIIVGGESGPRARPLEINWVRSLRDQATACGISFFFKQWGEYSYEQRLYGPDGEDWKNKNEWFKNRVGKKSSGRMLDGREWNEFPEAT